MTAARVAEVSEAERGEALRAGDPRAFQRSDLQLRVEACAGGGGLCRTEGSCVLDAMGVAVAAVDQPRRRRRPGQLPEFFVAGVPVAGQSTVEIRLTGLRVDRMIVRAV